MRSLRRKPAVLEAEAPLDVLACVEAEVFFVVWEDEAPPNRLVLQYA